MNYILIQDKRGWILRVYNQDTLTLVYQVAVVSYRDALRLLNWISENTQEQDKLFVA